MTTAPASLAALAALWVKHGGASLGIVGSAAHTHGYHLGRDRIYSAAGRGAADYSVQTARDRAGLTNAAAALDLGHADKAELRRFSSWLVARCLAKAPGTADIREVIYSPDGRAVRRYEASAGKVYEAGDGTGQGDDSHLWHTHISFYRDSEARSKTGMFAPFWAAPATQGADMPALTSYIPGQKATIKPAANIRSAPKLSAPILRVVDATPDVWVVTGWCAGDVDPDGGSNQWIVRWSANRWEYTAKSNVSAGPTAPPDPTPFSQADVDAKVDAAEKLAAAAVKDAADRAAAAYGA